MQATSQIQLTERFDDPLWRLNNLYFCVDENGKRMPFRMNYAQEKLFSDMWYFNIILKARQLGFTTFISILGLDQALFNPDFSVGACAHKKDDVEKIFDKKYKFPYNNLPEGLRTARETDSDSAKMMKFSNGSSIEVGLSLRSGTYQLVHVSEFGKLCLIAPDRAAEVVSGTLEAVHAGNMVFIESTAEGKTGKFAEYSMEALNNQRRKVKLNKLQYKFHFFPWHENKNYILDPEGVLIDKKQREYFEKLEREHGILLSPEQQAWWAQKQRNLGDRIKKEHPSTPEEAFEASIEGAYLTEQMAKVRSTGRIGGVPYDPRYPVNMGFDLGLSDTLWIWFHQRVGMENRIIDTISHSGEGLEWYAEQIRKKGYYIGRMFLPHDGGHGQLNKTGSSVADQFWDLGFRDIVCVPKIGQKITAINVSRSFLSTCYFDEEHCQEGIQCLDEYQKEWDDKNGCYRDSPKHNEASHGYDGFETLARGVTELGLGNAQTNSNPNSTSGGRSRGGRRRARGSWRTA